MGDIKQIVSKNILTLRTNSHITQAELAEKLNYSDKAVSKWERGESIPDVTVLKEIGNIFGVSVDYLLSDHENDDGNTSDTFVPVTVDSEVSYRNIAMVSIVGIWTLALLLFLIINWTIGVRFWQIFLFAVPVTCIVALVFSCIWGKSRMFNFWIISALVWSCLIVICVCVMQISDFDIWDLLTVGIPAEILIILSFNIRKKRKK